MAKVDSSLVDHLPLFAGFSERALDAIPRRRHPVQQSWLLPFVERDKWPGVHQIIRGAASRLKAFP